MISVGVRKKGGTKGDLEVCGLANQDRKIRWRRKAVVIWLTFLIQYLSRNGVPEVRRGGFSALKWRVIVSNAQNQSVEPHSVNPSTSSFSHKDLNASPCNHVPEGSELPVTFW